MKRGKHYIDSKKLIDNTKLDESQEAIALAVQTAKSKFDETIELHVKLGIDPRHADQQVRGVVVLPNGTGKTVRVLAICKGAKADEAQAAGADFVGGEEMVQKEDMLSIGADQKSKEPLIRLDIYTRQVTDAHRVSDHQLGKLHFFHIFNNAFNSIIHNRRPF